MPSNIWPSASRSHCSRPHGSAAIEPLGPLAHLVGGQQLAAREHVDLVEVVGGALVADRELGEPVDLVAPQVDADRAVGGGREHVDDRAADRDLAAVLDLFLAPVAGADEPGHEVVAVPLLARRDDEGLDVVDVRAEPLHQRPDRGDDDGGRAVRVAQPPDRAQPAAHGLDGRADPLERQRLPGREQLRRVGPEEGGEVVGQPLGVGGGGDGDEIGRRLPTWPGRRW